mmetsp:Transcript_36409/g.41857  ORF Transcript_36409/g.41857 Transcript_36409/m.41857 type:complete len:500 (-) Transcript_36409:152-1651(-)
MFMSSLQSKGMMLLSLVLLTETVTLTKAVRTVEANTASSFGGSSSSYSTSSGKSSANNVAGDSLSSCANTAGPCPAEASSMSSSTGPGRPPIKKQLGRFGKRVIGKKESEDDRGVAGCCEDFLHCTSSIKFDENYSQEEEQEQLLEECIVNKVLSSVPRGGHGGHGGAASVAAEAAAAGVAATKVVLPYNIPLNGWKIIFQCLLTTINVVCWLVPLQSKSFGENKVALSLANAFSGGVFLSLAFGHLIPECVHGFSTALAFKSGSLSAAASNLNEAAPYMLVLSGYLLIFFVEKVAFDAHGALHAMEHAQDHAVVPSTKKNQKQQKKQSNGCVAKQAAACATAADTSNSGRSALILLAALAVHSILEMAALGLSDSFKDSAILTISIALHQPAESIALLVAFLKSGMPKKQIIVYLSIFSMMGPIGCGLGIVVNEFADPIVDSIMLAVVAGTFVYVGATEVIPEEFEDSENKWKKFTALMSGIVSIFAITQYTMTLGLE